MSLNLWGIEIFPIFISWGLEYFEQIILWELEIHQGLRQRRANHSAASLYDIVRVNVFFQTYLAATLLKLRSEMELDVGVLLHCDLEGVGRLG